MAISENHHHLLWLLWLEECNWRTREKCHFFKLPLFMPICPVFSQNLWRLLHIISLVYGSIIHRFYACSKPHKIGLMPTMKKQYCSLIWKKIYRLSYFWTPVPVNLSSKVCNCRCCYIDFLIIDLVVEVAIIIVVLSSLKLSTV